MIIYVASPYTDDDPKVREARYVAVRDFVGKWTDGATVYFSPIVYAHEIAKSNKLPGDAAFWFEFNFRMMKVCDKVIVLQLPGWEKSVGVASEIAYAKSHDKPLQYRAYQKA